MAQTADKSLISITRSKITACPSCGIINLFYFRQPIIYQSVLLFNSLILPGSKLCFQLLVELVCKTFARFLKDILIFLNKAERPLIYTNSLVSINQILTLTKDTQLAMKRFAATNNSNYPVVDEQGVKRDRDGF